MIFALESEFVTDKKVHRGASLLKNIIKLNLVFNCSMFLSIDYIFQDDISTYYIPGRYRAFSSVFLQKYDFFSLCDFVCNLMMYNSVELQSRVSDPDLDESG